VPIAVTVALLVAPGVALATAVLELRVGEREEFDDAGEVENGVDTVVVVGVGVGIEVEVGDGMEVDVGVGVIAVVGVGAGVEVEVGDGVVVGVDVSVGTGVCFVTEFVANVGLAAIAWVLVTTVIAPINESSNNVMESTPTSNLLGVSLA
jgi:hypothetical protein